MSVLFVLGFVFVLVSLSVVALTLLS